MECTGAHKYRGGILYCSYRAGSLQGLNQAMALSCNIAFANLGIQVGRQALLAELQAFGFGRPPQEGIHFGQVIQPQGDERQLADLSIDGVRSFVSPDFAFDQGDQTWLLDWKTGSPRDDMELQLLAYALFARERWGVPAERLRAFDVFLPEVRLAEVEVTEERLAAAHDAVATQIAAMQAVLAQPTATEARKEDLPVTSDAHECRRCFFQEICDEQPPAATAP